MAEHAHPCIHAQRCTNQVAREDECCVLCAVSTCVLCEAVTRFDEHATSCSQHPENLDDDYAHDIAVPFARNH